MLTGIHHVGIIVNDLDKSLHFYQEVLGARFLYRAEAARGEVEKEVGVPGAETRLAVLKLGKDTIELVEYVNPKIRPGVLSAATVGTLHMAIEVDDIDAEVERLKGKGVEFNAAPKVIEEGENKGWVWTYFRDPDGCQLELVENRNLKVPL
ncbi:MAG: VOC family protein [Deltaproteobacteria bacterium]|nr:VOC family protein [Deltaproteobacteria bacterium]MBW2123800.1 VOC family protein [Deltaproteobacteria bacterium]